MNNRLIVVLTMWIGCAVSAWTADFCAVTIEVLTPLGRPIPYPLVAELLDSSGKSVEKTRIVGGVARFCDFGFGRHTIIIGGDECGSVAVQNIHLRYGLPQQFKAIKNTCQGGYSGGLNCGVYFRVLDDSGHKLAGAKLWRDGELLGAADEYGRFFTGLALGSSKSYTLSATNHLKQEIQVSCTENNPQLEREVVLRHE